MDAPELVRARLWDLLGEALNLHHDKDRDHRLAHARSIEKEAMHLLWPKDDGRKVA